MPVTASLLYRIGPATPADVEALASLLDELFRIERDFHRNLEKQRRGLSLLLAAPGRAVVLIARRSTDSHPCGMVTGQLVISTAEGAPSAWIEDLVVRAADRRRGVGRALLQAALDWASQRGATRAQLLVDGTNQPALTFYDRLGWRSTSMVARRLRNQLSEGGPR